MRRSSWKSRRNSTPNPPWGRNQCQKNSAGPTTSFGHRFDKTLAGLRKSPSQLARSLAFRGALAAWADCWPRSDPRPAYWHFQRFAVALTVFALTDFALTDFDGKSPELCRIQWPEGERESSRQRDSAEQPDSSDFPLDDIRSQRPSTNKSPVEKETSSVFPGLSDLRQPAIVDRCCCLERTVAFPQEIEKIDSSSNRRTPTAEETKSCFSASAMIICIPPDVTG